MEYKTKKTRPHRAEEDDEDYEDKPTGFKVKTTPLATGYTCIVDEPFISVKQFEQLNHILDHAGSGDIVEIKLTTPGGSLQAVLPTLTAMAGTDAKVLVHAISDVASAGTFLLMMADDVWINPYTTVMFHQVSFGAWGPGNHVADRVDHVMRSSSQLLRDLYQDFFTEEELMQMMQGKEFWLEKPEFDARYQRRNEIRDARVQAAMAEATAKQEQPPKPRRKRATEQPTQSAT